MKINNSITKAIRGRIASPLLIAALIAAAFALLLTVQSGPAEAQASNNDDLASISVDGNTVLSFATSQETAQQGVAHDTSQVTVLGTPDDSDATVAYSGTDADANTLGHQMNLSVGANTITITVTAENGTNTDSWTLSVNRGTAALRGWKASEDFDTLKLAGNLLLNTGIWSDGTTMWVTDDVFSDLDPVGSRLYAYNMATKARDTSKEIDLKTAGNRSPTGIWSNGTTMWVVDFSRQKIFAYNLSNGSRDLPKDIPVPDTVVPGPAGIWSDGTTMWIAGGTSNNVFAYNIATKNRDEDKEFMDVLPFGTIVYDLWSDGTTMWVANSGTRKVAAFNFSTGARQRDKDYTALSGAGNDNPLALWSDGTTMWVGDTADDKIYSYVYRLPNTDSAASEISVDGIASPGFDPDEMTHRHVIEAGTTQITVAVTANDEYASAEITSPEDAQDSVDGHQVDTSVGVTVIAITVTAEDGTTRTYTLKIARPSTEYFGWNQTEDLDELAPVIPGVSRGNQSPLDIWSDGTTLWVTDNTGTLFAYNLETKARTEDKDFDVYHTADVIPEGIWSDGETMWISDFVKDKLYAFDLESRARQTANDFNTLADAGNDVPLGIWSDGTTMWVVDGDDDKLYAYDLKSKGRKPKQDFDVSIDDYGGRTAPRSIWSDGRTMWISNSGEDTIYAFNMSTKERDPEKEFNTLKDAGNISPRGIWSDGTIMWVVDHGAARVFSYNLSKPGVLDLIHLGGEARDSFTGFSPDITYYDTREAPYNTDFELGGNQQLNFVAKTRTTGAAIKYPDISHVSLSDGVFIQMPDEGQRRLEFTVTLEGNPTHRTYTLDVFSGDSSTVDEKNTFSLLLLNEADSFTTTGMVGEPGDADWFEINAVNDGGTFLFTMRGAGYGATDKTLEVPFISRIVKLRRYFLDGERAYISRTHEALNAVGVRPHSGVDGWAQAIWKPNAVQTTPAEVSSGILDAYYIEVSSAEADDVGSYGLRIQRFVDDHYPNDTTSMTEVAGTGTDATETVASTATPGSKSKGKIDYPFDSDWFKVESLKAGLEYLIEARGGPAYHLVGIHDANGDEVGRNPKGGRFVFRPETTGTYYVVVYAIFPETRGRYRLWMHDQLFINGLTGANLVASKGDVLTIAPTDIEDPDGLDAVKETNGWQYRWIRVYDDGSTERIKAGKASTGHDTYTLTEDDVGNRVKARICYHDDRAKSHRDRECRFSPVSGTILPGTSNQQGNQPATGVPQITGDTNVGDTVTADVTGISDLDGLTTVSYAYQWLADNAAITGATASAYTLASGDFGKAVTVRVTFTDDAGNEETLTSDGIYPTMTLVIGGENNPATGAPTITGTAQVGLTLTASTSGIADEDGLQNPSYSYQWLADNTSITDATASTYLLTSDEQGKTIKVSVSFEDDAENEETLTSEATGTVASAPNSPATGAPTIDGTPQVGSTLTASTTAISDDDGLDDVSWSYQWVRNDGSADTDIAAATASTYTLVSDDESKTIKVKVTFADDAGNTEELTSTATATVAPKPNSPATGAPTISGTPQVGETLTASTSSVADTDGLDEPSYSYQWLRGDADITDATSSIYTLTSDDESNAIKVRVSFTDDLGNDETLTSEPTSTVAAKPNSAATGAPTISGTAEVGETLTADTSDISDTDGLDDVSWTYQWVRNNGSADANITDATSSAYTLTADDEGKTVKVQVEFTRRRRQRGDAHQRHHRHRHGCPRAADR